MSAHVPAALRQRVWERASGLCEYCLLHERDDWLAFQIDHLISRKHGGRTAYSNLALACSDCNLAKGPDLGSLTRRSGVLMPFFNPRKDRWTDHFRLNGHRIMTLTDTGEVTCRIMGLNSPKRLVKRQVISMAGRYPSIEALALMRE
jgi:hypothetical protein